MQNKKSLCNTRCVREVFEKVTEPGQKRTKQTKRETC